VCPSSLAHLDVCFGNNPHHALDGLEDFSHVWLVFLFDKNGTNYTPKAHVAPPRLKGDGAPSCSKGMRPCPQYGFQERHRMLALWDRKGVYARYRMLCRTRLGRPIYLWGSR
jgi:hypothetical protein